MDGWMDGWMGGWMGGWMDGSKSRVKDCLQQSKISLLISNFESVTHPKSGRNAQHLLMTQ